MHPHYVHNVQADAGADPGYTTTPWHQVEGLSAIDRIHATVVDWHDTDADEEKHHCHGNAICHVGPGGLGITQHLKEPSEHKTCRQEITMSSLNFLVEDLTIGNPDLIFFF